MKIVTDEEILVQKKDLVSLLNTASRIYSEVSTIISLVSKI